jgi:hypothetical protein
LWFVGGKEEYDGPDQVVHLPVLAQSACGWRVRRGSGLLRSAGRMGTAVGSLRLRSIRFVSVVASEEVADSSDELIGRWSLIDKRIAPRRFNHTYKTPSPSHAKWPNEGNGAINFIAANLSTTFSTQIQQPPFCPACLPPSVPSSPLLRNRLLVTHDTSDLKPDVPGRDNKSQAQNCFHVLFLSECELDVATKRCVPTTVAAGC